MNTRPNKTQNKFEKSIPDMTAYDYSALCSHVASLENRCDIIKISYLGSSILGRSIPMIKIGTGDERMVFYIGTHDANDVACAPVLLRFICELCEFYRDDRRIYSINVRSMLKSRTLVIVPVLNVDGIELFHHGVSEDNPLNERLMKMSGGEFGSWQSNARGVQLSLNYPDNFVQDAAAAGASGFHGENALSEPETSAVSSYLQFNENAGLILSFESGHNQIKYIAKNDSRTHMTARLLQRMSGCVPDDHGMGLTAYAAKTLDRMAYTIGCGKLKSNASHGDMFSLYASLRELLFTAPILI